MTLHQLARMLGSMLEARMLLRHITGLDDAQMITADAITLTESQSAELDDAVRQRKAGRPLSKIIGWREFYGLAFHVNDDVLDPRPETEMIVDFVLEHVRVQGIKSPAILDLGTGSGCIGVTLAHNLPGARVTLADISEAALKTARQNAIRHGVAERIDCIASDWLSAIEGRFDVIVSNPPYIETADIQGLAANVRLYDPVCALDGGSDGLAPYRVLCPQIRKHMRKGAILAFEHGTGQSNAILPLLKTGHFRDIQSHHDLSGHDRMITAIADKAV